MKPTKTGTVAIAIRWKGDTPELVDQFSDDREIDLLEVAVKAEKDPLKIVYALRERQTVEDEEFGNYVEDLLANPFLRTEVQDHAVQWLKSKIKIERYQRCEHEATQVIAQYAFKMFCENQARKDFLLAGPAAQVRIRVFELGEEKNQGSSESDAA